MDWMAEGRVLALDYGTRNVGVACSDELRMTVRPLPAIARRGKVDLLARLSALVRDNDIREVVVGLPLAMDGTSGESVRRVERFIDALRPALKLPFHTVDERLSTLEASGLWRAMSPRRQQKYGTVDSLAAALILKRYLEER